MRRLALAKYMILSENFSVDLFAREGKVAQSVKFCGGDLVRKTAAPGNICQPAILIRSHLDRGLGTSRRDRPPGEMPPWFGLLQSAIRPPPQPSGNVSDRIVNAPILIEDNRTHL